MNFINKLHWAPQSFIILNHHSVAEYFSVMVAKIIRLQRVESIYGFPRWFHFLWHILKFSKLVIFGSACLLWWLFTLSRSAISAWNSLCGLSASFSVCVGKRREEAPRGWKLPNFARKAMQVACFSREFESFLLLDRKWGKGRSQEHMLLHLDFKDENCLSDKKHGPCVTIVIFFFFLEKYPFPIRSVIWILKMVMMVIATVWRWELAQRTCAQERALGWVIQLCWSGEWKVSFDLRYVKKKNRANGQILVGSTFSKGRAYLHSGKEDG